MQRARVAGLATWVMVLFCSCSGPERPAVARLIETAAQMNAPEYVIALPTGAAAMTVGEKLFPRARLSYQTTHADAYVAVKTGKVDAYIYDRHALEYVVAKNPDLALLPDDLGEQNIVVGVSLARPELLAKVNDFIAAYRADGTYQNMYGRWMSGQAVEMPALPVAAQPELTLQVGTFGLDEPMSFYAGNGELTGFDVEFIHRLAYALNARARVTAMTFEALVAAVEAGKIDLLVASLNDTPERRRAMHLSKPYVDSRVCALVRKGRLAAKPSALDAFQGKTVASLSGTVFDLHIDRRIKQVRHQYFNDLSSMIVALEGGKVDAVGVDEPVGRLLEAQFPRLHLVPEPVCVDQYGFAITKGNPLGPKASAVIRKLKADGTLKVMQERWFNASDEGKAMPALDYRPDFDGSGGVLRFNHDNVNVPMCYVGPDGGSLGYDVELAARIAYELNMVFQPTPASFGGLLETLMARKADMVGGSMSITPERLKNVDFTEGYYTGGIYLLARREKSAPSGVSLAGKKVGVVTGSVFDQLQKEHLPAAIPEYYDSVADMLLSMKNGKLDAVIVDEPLARLCVARSPGLRIMPKVLSSADYAFVLNRASEALCREINEGIRALRADGTLAELDAIWFGADEKRRVVAALPATGPNGVLRLVMDPSLEPFSYIKDGKPVGFDVDMVSRIARKMGRGLEIMTVNFPALLPAIIAGKADIGVGGIVMTPERAQNVLFSESNYHGGVVVLMSDDSAAAPGMAAGRASWRGRFRSSFVSTFLVEDRYRLVLRGLGVTVLVSISAILLGTVLGAGVCALRRSRHVAAVVLAKTFIRGVQGTPILVMLMILYYVVFGHVDVNAIAIAVLAFAINFAVYAAEMFRAGVDAIDRGQIEAAEALGFHRLQVFFRIVLPQAARHVLPVFKGEVIATVKMTSVIGYIAIQDLTKVSDIIRSRTYEAFFPLLATALVYFVFAYLLASLLTLAERRIDPRQRPRVLKKVEVRK